MNSFHFNFNFGCHEQVLLTSKTVEPVLDFFPNTKKISFKIERFVCYKAQNQNTKYKKYQFCIFDFVTIRSTYRATKSIFWLRISQCLTPHPIKYFRSAENRPERCIFVNNRRLESSDGEWNHCLIPIEGVET